MVAASSGRHLIPRLEPKVAKLCDKTPSRNAELQMRVQAYPRICHVRRSLTDSI